MIIRPYRPADLRTLIELRRATGVVAPVNDLAVAPARQRGGPAGPGSA